MDRPAAPARTDRCERFITHHAKPTCPVPPAKETAGKPNASPLLYRALSCDPQDKATRILFETETLLRICGHRKIRVADVADACGFSAANAYRYFSSRRAILDTLASHCLREALSAKPLLAPSAAIRRGIGSVAFSAA